MTLTNDECRGLLTRYQEALASRGQSKTAKDNKLLALDSWRLTSLSSIVRLRVTPYMTKEELEKLMDCKLSRGKFRPRLKQLISSNSSDEVQQITTEAFSKPLASVEHILVAVKQLSVLKGVGPATATMVLQAYSDDVPFMSDEAMLQVFNGDKTKLKYDVKTCGIFIEKIQGILKMVGGEFSAAEIERALFTKEILGDSSTGDEEQSSGPRDAISPPPVKSKTKRKTKEDDTAASQKAKKLKSKSTNESEKEQRSLRRKK